MLSVKNLVKVYKTKGGAEVRALDGVTVDFPEKGMVFLLGKSGSGKSTLLNVAGGLDAPDSGEVIVKGKSSKNFSGADFDSYRNTYVGFVFQEYNILDEFNIEQNIALALQLQGKKNDKAAVNRLLEMVDLKGLGKRKPNTLSGGQKQRVAIARALIKEPEIIMADEPTGALDSATGKQVFETLKKLSATKLVIVVSHDREFAEQYGDRIIELKDGKVISDTSKTLAPPTNLSENVNAIGNDTVRVKDWSKLTQDEFNSIYNMMKAHGGEVIISSNTEDMTAIKRACKITDDGKKEYFAETKPEDTVPKKYDGSKTKFIKSRLPAGHAFKMGASGLKTKPVRLFFTIILSVISFAMFGILSTMMLYDSAYSIADALQGSPYTAVQLNKSYKYTRQDWRIDKNGNRELNYEYNGTNPTLFGASEIEELNNNSLGLSFAGICTSGDGSSFSTYIGTESSDYYAQGSQFSGFTDCGEEYLTAAGYTKLAGDYPDSVDEVAVSEYIYNAFAERGYRSGSGNTSTPIKDHDDLIGKTITIEMNGNRAEVTISGIYATGEPTSSDFEILKQDDNSSVSPEEYNNITTQFNDVISTGFYSLAFVTPEFIDEYADCFDRYDNGMNRIDSGYMYGRIDSYDDYYGEDNQVDEYYTEPYYSVDTVNNNADAFRLYPVSGSQSSSLTLGEKEAYASLGTLWNAANNLANSSKGEYYELYRDASGETVRVMQNEYRSERGFWANAEGDISFTEKDGYVFIQDGRGYIFEDEYYGDDPAWQWQQYNQDRYYENIYGDTVPEVQKEFIVHTQGYYYENNNNPGEYSLMAQEEDGWIRHDQLCYYVNNTDGGVAQIFIDRNDISPEYYFEIPVDSGIFYYNWNTNEIRFTDPADDVITFDGYWLDYEGNLIESPEAGGYEYRNCVIYTDPDTGEIIDNPSDGVYYNEHTGFYLTEDGEVSLDWPENAYNVENVIGFYVDPDTGDLSMEKRDGYIFADHYYEKDGDIIFATQYYETWYDAEDNAVVSPYNGMASQSQTRSLYYIDYPENAEFAEAYRHLRDAYDKYYGYDPDAAVGDPDALTAADINLILSCIEKDWEEWYGSWNEEDAVPDVLTLTARNSKGESESLTVKGFFICTSGNNADYILNKSFADDFQVMPSGMQQDEYTWEYITATDYEVPADARYNYAITPTQNTMEQTSFVLVDTDTYSYGMTNEIYSNATMITSMLETMQLVFLIAGAVMAVLSALMLFNFISASITAKNKEIGVLRAVGARGTDVFKIFFAEAFIIAIICFVIATVGAGVACFLLNGIFVGNAMIGLSVLNFGLPPVGLIFGISIVISFIATILPVFFAARKSPVESIRAL